MRRDPYLRDRRLGRWKMRQVDLEDLDWWDAQVIQSTMFVLDVQRDYMRDTVTFLGRGQAFDIVPLGEEVPQYTPKFEADGSVKWERATHDQD